jgi:hypothetical protein
VTKARFLAILQAHRDLELVLLPIATREVHVAARAVRAPAAICVVDEHAAVGDGDEEFAVWTKRKTAGLRAAGRKLAVGGHGCAGRMDNGVRDKLGGSLAGG